MNPAAVFCAIDTPEIERAEELAAMIAGHGIGLKLGLEFFNAQGPQGVRRIRERHPDLPFFLDLKFHDIPNTVAGAVRAVCALEPGYVNVHCTGGPEMMRRAAEVAAEANTGRTRVLGVTVLTSLGSAALAAMGMGSDVQERTVHLAVMAKVSGLAGVVCAGPDIAAIREACGPDFVLMVPGIRPAGAAAHDQKRVMTPREAVAQGATHLVIGRPITGAPDPSLAVEEILNDLAA